MYRQAITVRQGTLMAVESNVQLVTFVWDLVLIKPIVLQRRDITAQLEAQMLVGFLALMATSVLEGPTTKQTLC